MSVTAFTRWRWDTVPDPIVSTLTQVAVRNEDYKLARVLKEQILGLEEVGVQLGALQRKKYVAVSAPGNTGDVYPVTLTNPCVHSIGFKLLRTKIMIQQTCSKPVLTRPVKRYSSARGDGHHLEAPLSRIVRVASGMS